MPELLDCMGENYIRSCYKTSKSLNLKDNSKARQRKRKITLDVILLQIYSFQ